MSMINKLCIQGVRSFGNERQKIEFNTPLSMIVGENGCGKTTIIECLKYALTGDVPPGSDRGRNFIHDVKLLDKNTSDARVELTITDPNGVDKTVFRSMRLELVKGKIKFTTFDSTIKYSGEKDKFTSGRVEDVNNHMCESMGVSKAIINNVIFCHQEDSNWPLDEGKKLKEKFDAIFGTTEYNNAISKLLKIRKQYDDELKQVKADIKVCLEIKSQVETKERNLVDVQKKLDVYQQQFDKHQEQLKPLENQRRQIMEKEKNYVALSTEDNALELKIKSKRSERENLEKRLEEKLDMDLTELMLEKENFLENKKQKQKELDTLESTNEKYIQKERDIQNSLFGLTNSITNCTEQISKLQELKAERFDKVKHICSMLKIDFNYDKDQSADTQDISETIMRIKEGIAEKEEAIKSMVVKARQDDVNYQKKLDELRDQKTKIETNLVSQRRAIKEFDENARKIQKELNESQESIPKLNELKKNIEKFQKELTKLTENSKINELKDNQDIMQSDIVEMEENLSVIDRDIEILQSVTRITSELDLKQSDLSKDQKEFERIRNKVTPSLRNLFAQKSIEADYRAKVQNKSKELEKEVKDIEESIQKIKRDRDRLTDQKAAMRTQQKQKDQEIQKIEDRTNDLCDGIDYVDYLASQKEKVEKLNLELAVKESSKNTYKDFIKKIDDTPCCPLCHKGLDDDDADRLKVELEENIEELPIQISTIRQKLKRDSEIYEKLLNFKSSFDGLEKLKAEKKKLDEDLKSIEKKLIAKNNEKDDLEGVLTEPKSLLNLITQSFFADICKLDDLQRSIATKSKDVNALKAKLPSDIPQKTLNEAQSERKEISENIKKCNEKYKQMNEEINEYQARLNDTREKLNNLNTKKNDMQEKIQGIEVLNDQLAQIKVNKKKMEVQIKENERKLEPTIEEFEAVTVEKQESHKSHQKAIEDERNGLNRINRENDVERIDGEIEKLEKMDLDSQINRLKKDMDSLRSSKKSIDEKLVKLKEKIQELNDYVRREDVQYRNILDNIDLLRLEEEEHEAVDKLNELRKKIGDLDLEKMQAEKRNCLRKIDEMTTECLTLKGKMDGVRSGMKLIEDELNIQKYRDAKKNYLDALSREEVLSAACSDLKKYTAALEKSLLKYHQEKMDQINQIMKELWNSIYQGNDIDYILIKTDEDESTTKSEKSRRSYNYRVVQVKNNVEIDMRGRCSAGQKVLASLIIRIALADTFSSSCGILALDEPTTNLDHNNITSLSNALAQLVNERDNGRFMLIIITHDETFVKTLERAEKYWKLSRDAKGCSVIEEYRNY